MIPNHSKPAAIEEHGKAGQARQLPKRDYLLLPLISLATVVCLLGIAEIGSRLIWPKPVWDSCFYWDGDYGPRDRPNCTSDERIPESPITHNVFNACGYRTYDPCGPKAEGTIRVAVLGSSVAEGLLVPMNETWAALAQRELENACRRTVEFEQLTAPLQSPFHARNRTSEALKLRPDAVLLMLTPIDIEALTWYRSQLTPAREAAAAGPSAPENLRQRIGAYANELQGKLLDSGTAFSVEHVIFRNPAVFTQMYLVYGDKADFLRQPFTPAWERRFADLDYLVGDMARQIQQARIPFFVTAVPSRADAALLSSGVHYPAVDPFAWGHAVADITRRHKASYIDLLSAYSSVPRSDLFYYLVDGHMNSKGQPVMAKAVVKGLLASGASGFGSCSPPSSKAPHRAASIQ